MIRKLISGCKKRVAEMKSKGRQQDYRIASRLLDHLQEVEESEEGLTLPSEVELLRELIKVVRGRITHLEYRNKRKINNRQRLRNEEQIRQLSELFPACYAGIYPLPK